MIKLIILSLFLTVLVKSGEVGSIQGVIVHSYTEKVLRYFEEFSNAFLKTLIKDQKAQIDEFNKIKKQMEDARNKIFEAILKRNLKKKRFILFSFFFNIKKKLKK